MLARRMVPLLWMPTLANGSGATKRFVNFLDFSLLYGRLDCPAALRAIARGGYVTHRVFFLTEEHARDAGYRPCGVCLPVAYASWKASREAYRVPSQYMRDADCRELIGQAGADDHRSEGGKT